jgi:formimidoylglutamate deiminase
VNAHSHGFQRALRGRGAGSDFWAWRDTMVAEAGRQTLRSVRTLYGSVYREQRASGYTAVGEFHYLGFEAGHAVADAASEAGIELVLLYVAYGRGGLDRFRQQSPAAYLRDLERLQESGVRVGLAPHSVRACPKEWLTEIGRYGASTSLPLHVHACEQPREVDECLAEYAMRPIQLLADAGCLTERTTVVHATHASEAELELVAEAGAGVCLCPTTEAHLGDGFAQVGKLLERGIPISIGSDSNVRIDPLEELREISGIARRESRTRDVVSTDDLFAMGAANGAAALGIEAWPGIAVDLAHASLARVARGDVTTALIDGCSADVLIA